MLWKNWPRHFYLLAFLRTSFTICASKNFFVTLVTVCHLKLLAVEQCCNYAQMNYSGYEFFRLVMVGDFSAWWWENSVWHTAFEYSGWNLETPYVSYLLDCQPLSCAPNSNSIAQAVDDAARTVGTNRNSFHRFLSDAAKYMVVAGSFLKLLYSKLFHVTSVAHLLHNCALKVWSHFQDAEQLIEKVKLVTVETKTRLARFATVGHLPQPVFTRRES